MAQLVTTWSTDASEVQEILDMIRAEPENSVPRMELEAALHTWQAQWLHRRIGVLQTSIAASQRRRRKPAVPPGEETPNA